MTMLGTPALAQTSYPLRVNNCGVDVVVSAAPQRVVAIKSNAVELLLALGLEDRIAAVAFQDGPVPEPWASSAADLQVLSDKLPAQEVVLEADPDFVYGGWESNFVGDGAGERQSWAALGIPSYVTPAACRSVKPPALSFEQVFAEIREMGGIMDAAAAAEALVANQQAQLASVNVDERNLTAVWYSSGTKTPYVGAGSNAPAMIMNGLGLANIFADVDDGWISASWEAIADADPDVIVLVDAAWNSVEQKRKLLGENPITSQMSAVRNERYLVIPFPASEAGVRNVPAVADLAKQLASLDFTE
ncbi:putative F420-0 ABC transporter substrate-binding protein [Devosia albogilva]|uniref:F420-0 ABC transporter substrate-binding protein n=1 Tax=Devosia albogilva TaxID=429726 RepID=A0ABW5QPU1_9HYPH